MSGKRSQPTRSAFISHRDLQSLPGVGPSIAADLAELGYRDPADLRGEDPERMFQELNRLRGHKIDRCVLYVFRCAVYHANHDTHDPELSKWWHWRDSED